MKQFVFQPNPNTNAKVTAFLHSLITTMENHRTHRPSVIVIPGGAYQYCSLREEDPVVMEYLAAGFHVFLLDYSVDQNAKNYAPLCDLGHTIMTIRQNAESWGCIPHQIAVIGFSAGGHLAACSGTMWNEAPLQNHLNSFDSMHRPDAMILCYPVICANEYAHQLSIELVSGAQKGTKEYEFWSVDKHVDNQTCPAFIWHTITDQSVPVENSIAMITALQKHHISYECHLFPEGIHGMSVCTKETGSADSYNRRWVDMSIEWLYKLFNYQK